MLYIHFAEVNIKHIKLHTYFQQLFWILGVIQPWGEMSPEEFSAMYISSCVISSLASIVFRRSIGSQGVSLGAVSIT